MILCPPGFYKSQRPDHLLLQPPDGLGLEPFRYREKQKPLRSLRQIVLEVCAENDGIEPLQASLPDDFVTAEGEFAAQTAVLFRYGQRVGYLHVAAVFGDDSVDIIDTMVVEPRAFENTALLVKQLAYTCKLGLGYRKRRYLFTPPLGFFHVAKGLVTRFYPPSYPNEPAMLVVHPAVPRTLSPHGLCASLVERHRQKGLLFEHEGAETPLTSDHGLHGLTFCLSAKAPGSQNQRWLQDLLIFADAHYLYLLAFESTSETHRESFGSTLSDVARSVRPLSAPAEKIIRSDTGESAIYL